MAPYTGCHGIYLSKTAASKLTNESIKWAERKTIGIRFNPSDEVLAGFFLLRKVHGRTDNPVFQLIKDIKVYKYEPSELSDVAYEFGEGKMYFFTTLCKKYPTTSKKYSDSQRTIFDRTVLGGGFWKKTGSDSFIDVVQKDVKLRATKKSLAFYKNGEKSGKREKTPWLMKEYMLDRQSYEKWGMSDDPLVLCVVYFNDDGKQNQCRNENKSCEQRDERSSTADMLMGCSKFLSAPASSSFLPPTPNCPNIDCQRNSIPLSPAENPGFHRKRLRPSPQILPDSIFDFPIFFDIQNLGCAASHPQLNPAASFQQGRQFQVTRSDQNTPTLGAPDSNLRNPNDTPFPEQEATHASNGISGEHFGPNYQQHLSYGITDSNIWGQNLESNMNFDEPILYTDDNCFF